MNANDKYLKAFFEEKEVQEQVFQVTHNGTTHLVESGFIIEMIKGTQGNEQAVIVKIIRNIDFANGNINHFIQHLAKGYIKSNY